MNQPSSDDRFQRLVESPQERLDTELKPWLSLNETAHVAKFAKACLAMRNNGGGYFVLGFEDDGTQSRNPPADPRVAYQIDDVQAIVSKFASDPFAIEIEFRSVNGIEHPIVVVPPGVVRPVAAKSSLAATDPTKPALIEDHAIYVRSITSNNTVSSSKLRKQDIERLMSICFENREADIGSFIRRHLVGVDLATLLANLQPQPIQTEERSVVYLDESLLRLKSVFADREISFPNFGYMEASAVFKVEGSPLSASQNTLFSMMANRRNYSGWSPWTIIYNQKLKEMNPYHFNGTWEALMHNPEPSDFGGMSDFWRADPKGKLYYFRVFEEDLGFRSLTPFLCFDFYIAVFRLTEVIAAILELSRLFAKNQTTTIEFAVRWTGLKNRKLGCWSKPERRLRGNHFAQQETASQTQSFPSDTGLNAIPVLVHQAIQPLFLAFEGQEFDKDVIEGIASDILNGRS